MTEYLGLDDLVHIIRRFGFHIRDAGLLSSALARPGTTIGGVEAYPETAFRLVIGVASGAIELSAAGGEIRRHVVSR